MSNISKLLMLLFIGLTLACASIWFIGGKKKEYDVTATIKARPYQLFPYLVQPELKKKWLLDLKEQDLVSTDALEEGSESVSVWDVDGESVNFKDRFIRYAPNEVVSIRSTNGEQKITTFFRLTEKGNDTEINYRKIVKLKGVGRFMSVFDDDMNQTKLESEMSQLIKVVESENDNTIPDPNADLKTVGVESESGSGSDDDQASDAGSADKESNEGSETK